MNKGRKMKDSIYDTESHEYRFGNHFHQISIPFKFKVLTTKGDK